MLVQDPTRVNDVESLFNQARQAGAEEGIDQLQPSSSSRSFAGRGRLLSGETPPAATQHTEPEFNTHTITFWTNGFTVNDGPLRRLDDPQNASFLEVEFLLLNPSLINKQIHLKINQIGFIDVQELCLLSSDTKLSLFYLLYPVKK